MNNNRISVSKILLNNINKNINKNFSVDLNEDEIIVLNNMIIKYPIPFSSLSFELNKIVTNKIIDYDDIPEIINLISKMYIENLNKKILDTVDITNIIRYTIDSLLDSGTLPLSNMELVILKKIIDSSIELLKLNISNNNNANNDINYCCF